MPCFTSDGDEFHEAGCEHTECDEREAEYQRGYLAGLEWARTIWKREKYVGDWYAALDAEIKRVKEGR